MNVTTVSPCPPERGAQEFPRESYELLRASYEFLKKIYGFPRDPYEFWTESGEFRGLGTSRLDGCWLPSISARVCWKNSLVALARLSNWRGAAGVGLAGKSFWWVHNDAGAWMDLTEPLAPSIMIQ